MSRNWWFVGVLVLIGCGSDGANNTGVLGEGYAGPMVLSLRKEISPRSAETAQVKHGEKVEILERRRSFLRVRASGGRVGWLHARQLMSAEQMEAIRKLAIEHEDTPKVGQATVYEQLNLHNEPNRQSPGFTQIAEKERVDVLAYLAAPRSPYQTPQLIKPPPAPVKRARRKRAAQTDRVAPPPAPAAPSLPDKWLDISKSTIPKEEEPPPPPVRRDDWTLVRKTDGTVGWALSSMLIMAIPEEVAQYSEGHRIMGYWPLGSVQDGEIRRNHWLWVTQSQRGADFPFDGFRIFMYSVKRQRYEQAYREKKVRGHFPVEVGPGANKEYLSEFWIITENEDGQLIRRRFAFLGYRVNLLETLPYDPSDEDDGSTEASEGPSGPRPEAPEETPWYRRWLPRS